MVLTEIATMSKGHEAPGAAAAVDLADWVDCQARRAARYLRFLGCDASRCDDILQDALIAAIEHGQPERPEPVAAAWLRTTVRNLWLMELRHKRNRPALAELSDAAAIDAAWSRFVGADATGDEAVQHLEACLEHLAPRSRAAVDRFYRGDESRAAIAQDLGMQVEGVKTLLRRAKDELRSCIENKRGTE